MACSAILTMRVALLAAALLCGCAEARGAAGATRDLLVRIDPNLPSQSVPFNSKLKPPRDIPMTDRRVAKLKPGCAEAEQASSGARRRAGPSPRWRATGAPAHPRTPAPFSPSSWPAAAKRRARRRGRGRQPRRIAAHPSAEHRLLTPERPAGH